MQEYYKLVKNLLLVTLGFIVIITVAVWYFSSANIALNYLLGASCGLVYLRMLAKDVEQVGQQKKRLGARGLVLFSGLIIVAAKWQQLHILPIFLGFMTYKAAIIFHLLQPNFGMGRQNN